MFLFVSLVLLACFLSFFLSLSLSLVCFLFFAPSSFPSLLCFFSFLFLLLFIQEKDLSQCALFFHFSFSGMATLLQAAQAAAVAVGATPQTVATAVVNAHVADPATPAKLVAVALSASNGAGATPGSVVAAIAEEHASGTFDQTKILNADDVSLGGLGISLVANGIVLAYTSWITSHNVAGQALAVILVTCALLSIVCQFVLSTWPDNVEIRRIFWFIGMCLFVGAAAVNTASQAVGLLGKNGTATA